MAKFYGIIGYGTQGEIEPGIYEDMIIEKKYQGELLKNYKSQRSTDNVIDNITISNQVSIIADPYATEHFFDIKYIRFKYPKLGGVWKVTDVTVEYPRLTLSIGGVYNGPTSETSTDIGGDSWE